MIPMRGARRDYQLASVEHRPARVASLGAVFDLGGGPLVGVPADRHRRDANPGRLGRE